MKHKKKSATRVSHDRWLVSYADFITLLFAFFVVLYSAAQVDKRKIGKLAAGIQTAFEQLGPFPATGPPRLLPTPSPVSFNNPPPGPVPQPPEQNRDLMFLRKELEQALAPEILRGEVALRDAPDGLVVSLRETGFFDSGSAGIKVESEPAFARMATLLEGRQCNLRIEGHTDNVPIHNSQYSSNWELSTARSTEMIRLLITKYHFAPARLTAAGYAEYHPIASNDTEAGRALNRRVDVVILGQPQPTGISPTPK
jgi:chemotaxis protein MotB